MFITNQLIFFVGKGYKKCNTPNSSSFSQHLKQNHCFFSKTGRCVRSFLGVILYIFFFGPSQRLFLQAFLVAASKNCDHQKGDDWREVGHAMLTFARHVFCRWLLKKQPKKREIKTTTPIVFKVPLVPNNNGLGRNGCISNSGLPFKQPCSTEPWLWETE